MNIFWNSKVNKIRILARFEIKPDFELRITIYD